MISKAISTGSIMLPLIDGEFSMLPFCLNTMQGLPEEFRNIAASLLAGIKHQGGEAFFTIHGKKLKKFESLRRGGAHTDGSYDKRLYSWGGPGWKVGKDTGPAVGSPEHDRLYNSEKGGIILASNFESCLGWIGEYEGLPSVGGNCSHIKLDTPFILARNTVYYGNNHFIHESLPVAEDVHRVLVRITLPHTHEYTA